jgi:hypothetical protein
MPIIDDTMALLKLEVFSPNMRDPNISLQNRLKGKKVTVANIGTNGIRYGIANFTPKGIKISKVKDEKVKLQTKEDLVKRLPLLMKDIAKPKMPIIVGISHKIDLSLIQDFEGGKTELETNLKMRQSPELLLESNHKASHIYATLQHPQLPQALAFSVEKQFVGSIVQSLNASKSVVCRLQITALALANCVMGNEDITSSNPTLYFEDNGHLFFVRYNKSTLGWEVPRVKANAFNQDPKLSEAKRRIEQTTVKDFIKQGISSSSATSQPPAYLLETEKTQGLSAYFEDFNITPIKFPKEAAEAPDLYALCQS